jgi:hypothetical protein
LFAYAVSSRSPRLPALRPWKSIFGYGERSESGSGIGFVHPQDLMKPDLLSEVLLLSNGMLVFVILMLILVVALTQASALV